MDLLSAIEHRRSVRAFRDDPVPDVDALARAGTGAPPLADAPCRVLPLPDGRAVDGGLDGLLGSYGRVFHAPAYLAVAGVPGPGWLEDAGFRLEHAILEATARGYGTCWIGGMFREARLAPLLHLAPGERVVAVSPVGRPREESLVGRAFRGMIGSDNRLPADKLFSWERPGTPLPPSVGGDPRVARWLEAVRMGPSWANKQPWRFVLDPAGVMVWKAASQVREDKDYHLVDCGIALAHLAIAGTALGFPGRAVLGGEPVPGVAEVVGRYVLDEPLAG